MTRNKISSTHSKFWKHTEKKNLIPCWTHFQFHILLICYSKLNSKEESIRLYMISLEKLGLHCELGNSSDEVSLTCSWSKSQHCHIFSAYFIWDTCFKSIFFNYPRSLQDSWQARFRSSEGELLICRAAVLNVWVNYVKLGYYFVMSGDITLPWIKLAIDLAWIKSCKKCHHSVIF
jgi:hypothetical protein